jgi:hypothetical protein
MAVPKLLPFDAPGKTLAPFADRSLPRILATGERWRDRLGTSARPGIFGLRIGPRMHLRLCGELLDLATAHSRDIQSIETGFEVLLSLVQGARR